MKIQRILNPFRGKSSSKGRAAGGTGDLTGRHRAPVDEVEPNECDPTTTRAASPMEDSVQYDYQYPADFYDDFNDDNSNVINDTQIQQNQKVFGEVESYFGASTTNSSHDGSAASARVRPQQQQRSPPSNNNNNNNSVRNNKNANTVKSTSPSRSKNNSPRKTTTTKTTGTPKITTVRVPPPQQQQQQQQQHDPADRSAQTRHLVKQFIADIWNRGELDLIPSVCSPSLRFNGNTGFDRVGHDGLARMVAHMRECLAEYHCEIHSMVVEDNKCFCRLRFTGKHVGPLLGYAPTQQAVAWMGASEYTIQNEKILKVWELGDVKSLEEQLQGKAAAECNQRSTSIARNVD